MNINRYLSFVFAVALFVVMVACAPVADQSMSSSDASDDSMADSGDAQVVSLWWHTGTPEEQAAMDDAVERFNAMGGPYVIEKTDLPGGTYTDQSLGCSQLDCVGHLTLSQPPEKDRVSKMERLQVWRDTRKWCCCHTGKEKTMSVFHFYDYELEWVKQLVQCRDSAVEMKQLRGTGDDNCDCLHHIECYFVTHIEIFICSHI